MLGTIGIHFEIAIAEHELDGYNCGEVEMDIISEKPGISTAHLRKICNIPLFKSDSKFLFQLWVRIAIIDTFFSQTRPIFQKFRLQIHLSLIMIAMMRTISMRTWRTIGDHDQ